jgi:diaminopimelate epimerase
MTRGLVLEFTKMHGAGNDFMVVDNRFFRFSDDELSEIAATYCPRRIGIGADGLLALDVADADGFDFRMRYFNADGSLGEMCGNGARCLAAFAREAGVGSQPLHFQTGAGPHRAYIEDDDVKTVRLILPASRDVDLDYAVVNVAPNVQLDLAFMITGVPHAVWFGNGLDEIPVETWGSRVRHDKHFTPSAGTNVDFAEVVESADEVVLQMRTYERGVEAETFACGTGAVSTLVTAYESGRIGKREAVVRMVGGTVRVGYVEGTDEMFLEGSIAYTYRGTVVL